MPWSLSRDLCKVFPTGFLLCPSIVEGGIGGQADGLTKMFGYTGKPWYLNFGLLSCRNMARTDGDSFSFPIFSL